MTDRRTSTHLLAAACMLAFSSAATAVDLPNLLPRWANPLPPATLSFGEEVRVRFTVRNTGQADSGPYSWRVDLIPAEPGAHPVFSAPTNGAVEGVPAGGRSPQFERSVLIPASRVPGNFEIVVVVDTYHNQVHESNEADNTIRRAITVLAPDPGRMMAPPRPTQPPAPVGAVQAPPREIPKVDLVVDAVSVTSNDTPITASSAIFVHLDVANRGQANALASTCRVNLHYTKVDGRPGLTNVTNLAVPRLAIGATFSGAPSVSLPANLRPGSAKVAVILDPEYLFAESDETNNSKEATFTVAGPDFVVENVRVEPGSTSPGGEFTVWMTFRNRGTARAPVAGYKIELSTSRTFGSATELHNGMTQGALDPGAANSFGHRVRIPAGWDDRGPHYIRVVVDYTLSIGEMNENNNQCDPVMIRVTS